MICDIFPLKSDPHRVHMIVGGEILEYDGDHGSPDVLLLDTHIFLNNLISDANLLMRI